MIRFRQPWPRWGGALFAALLLGLSACDDGGPPATAAPRLEPGEYTSPLVQLMRIRGKNQHMHIDEVRWRAKDNRVFLCSYTFAALDVANPADPKYLVEELKHKVPGDTRSPGCIHLAWDGDVTYTTHRGNLSNPTFISGWKFGTIPNKNPDLPGTPTATQIPVLQEAGESYEGIDVQDGVVYVALRGNGMATYTRDAATDKLTRIGSVSGLGSTWGLRVAGKVAYLTDITGGLVTVDIADPKAPKLLGKVATGGTGNGLALSGTTAWVAAGPAGLVAVDCSNPASPKVVSKTDTGGSAVRVEYSEDHVVVSAWNDTKVYNVKDPTKPVFIGAARLTNEMAHPDDGHPPVTARTLGAAINGKSILVGNWWVPYSYRLYPERKAPSLVLTEEANLVDFGPATAGKQATQEVRLRNQGTAPLTLFNNWTTNPAFSVSPDQLRLKPGEAGKLTLTFKAKTDQKEVGQLYLFSDDPLQPLRYAFLTANQPGVGVGKPFPETRMTLLDNGAWASKDTLGKPLVVAYFATF